MTNLNPNKPLNQKRLERQKVGVHRWQHSKAYGSSRNGSGTLNYYTGVGKTIAAFLIIKNVLTVDAARIVIVLVPTEQLEKDWKTHAGKLLSPEMAANVQVYTIQYVQEHNLRLECTLLIVDELHEYYSDDRMLYITNVHIRYKYNLGLTATFEDRDKRHHRIYEFFPIVDKITKEEAIKQGFISDYYEYNLGITLTPFEQEELDAFSKDVTRYLAKFGEYGFKGAAKCLSGDKDYSAFQYATMWALKNGWTNHLDKTKKVDMEIDMQWNPQKIMGYAKNLMEAVRQRKEILYCAENKYRVGMEILRKFPQLKTICFSQSTAFADKFCLLVNKEFGDNYCVAYHSNLSSRPLKDEYGEMIRYQSGQKKGQIKMFGKDNLRKFAIERIRNGKSRVISTAQALDKGFDVPDIELGIKFSGTSNPTQHSQRSGRVLRLKPEQGEDEKVLIINVYVMGTADERWLKDSQYKNSENVMWVKSVDEIVLNPFTDDVYSIPSDLLL